MAMGFPQTSSGSVWLRALIAGPKLAAKSFHSGVSHHLTRRSPAQKHTRLEVRMCGSANGSRTDTRLVETKL
jgi:hypothetical protein